MAWLCLGFITFFFFLSKAKFFLYNSINWGKNMYAFYWAHLLFCWAAIVGC